MDSDEEREREYEERVFETFRVAGTALMDQYDAHVKNLLGMLTDHRPHCVIFNEHGSEMCTGVALVEAVESMSVYSLQRALVMSLIMLARKE